MLDVFNRLLSLWVFILFPKLNEWFYDWASSDKMWSSFYSIPLSSSLELLSNSSPSWVCFCQKAQNINRSLFVDFLPLSRQTIYSVPWLFILWMDTVKYKWRSCVCVCVCVSNLFMWRMWTFVHARGSQNLTASVFLVCMPWYFFVIICFYSLKFS